MAAHAPRSDRLQVLQDLESQIADMLAREAAPLTKESVRAVLDKARAAAVTLPPPTATAHIQHGPRRRQAVSHGCREHPGRSSQAASCALLCLVCLLAMFAVATDAHGPFDLFMSLAVLSFVVTPVALWMAYRHLRAHPDMQGRDLVLKSACAYIALALALLMLFLATITEGFVLIALGVAAFVYFEYLLIRRLWRRLADALPPQLDVFIATRDKRKRRQFAH